MRGPIYSSLRASSRSLTSRLSSSTSRPLLRPENSTCIFCAHQQYPLLTPPQQRPHSITTIRRNSTIASPATPTPQPAQAPPPPPKQRTHYDLFPQTLPSGPPPAGPFAIDLRALRNEFLRLQSIVHPDRQHGQHHHQATEARIDASSALINEAYKTLQSPLLRAQYLLALRGIDVGTDETARVDPEEEGELLMTVMEVRERLEEEVRSEEELEPIRRENEARIEGSVKRLAECFARDDLEGARREAVRLRYWINVRESVDNWEKGGEVRLQH